MQRTIVVMLAVTTTLLAIAGHAMGECPVEAEYDEESSTAKVEFNSPVERCVRVDSRPTPPDVDIVEC